MTDPKTTASPEPRNYKETLFLPQTDFPMRANLARNEPAILARWQAQDLYTRLREKAAGCKKFILHDGPPYANGHLHIGHALNKILKDIIIRSQQMMGFDANYVPGWDCHGLPIEWKVEENYRSRGQNKDDIPINEFRSECRNFAAQWIDIQRKEFKRFGLVGDWDHPYTTMDFKSESLIAAEFIKFVMNGALYHGSKPVMWSVVEKTTLAEAEVEYLDYRSDTIWVKFPITQTTDENVKAASVVIWTTTPWTIPGNRAISYSPKIAYGLYCVEKAPEDNWARPGDRLVIADNLARHVFDKARVEEFKRVCDVNPKSIAACAHPLRDMGYDFDVPLLAGGHVTDQEGTGFVHTAPGHGTDDFDIWMENDGGPIPFIVDAEGVFTEQAPGFTGKRVLNENGDKGDANDAVIQALAQANALIARGRLRHQYPHSWRSKKPVIFRNTPQWFIAMDHPLTEDKTDTLRARALNAIATTRFVPAAGQNRLRPMIEARPDWVLSRQRAWGVPLTCFINRENGELLRDKAVNARIIELFAKEGADTWFAENAASRFLGDKYDPSDWQQVTDILDVWFDSGSTHAFVLEQRKDLHWPADLYLEGSDQHRGWFQSSLLESCATRGRAPYKAVLTHGFTLDGQGYKMSKSKANTIDPQKLVAQSGADVLRLWVASCDYAEDQRIGPEIIKSNADSYRKIRNTLRFLLGALSGFTNQERVENVATMPELERYILHRLYELDRLIRQAYNDFDFKCVFQALFNFCITDLSAFYFDIRKDSLYCDALDNPGRRACRTVLDYLFSCLTTWFAPILAFTMEEIWLCRFPGEEQSVHLQNFFTVPEDWRDQALADKWQTIRTLRRVITGALEVEREQKHIGSSLEAAPVIYIAEDQNHYITALQGLDLAEIAITSQAVLREAPAPGSPAPEGAFSLDGVPGIAVIPEKAKGNKCRRSWKILPEVGADPDYPDLSPRDAAVVRAFDQAKQQGQCA